MICVQTFENKNNSDFSNWDGWVGFVNDNNKYCETKSKPFDWVGKVKSGELPSQHPYFKYLVNEELKKSIAVLENKLDICKKDFNFIKVHFNNSTSLKDIETKITKLKHKLTIF